MKTGSIIILIIAGLLVLAIIYDTYKNSHREWGENPGKRRK